MSLKWVGVLEAGAEEAVEADVRGPDEGDGKILISKHGIARTVLAIPFSV